MASMEEQETTVTQIRNGDTSVYTANPVHIRALDKRVAEGKATVRRTWAIEDRVEAREYTVPAGGFDPLKGFKRTGTPRTPEQRKADGERLRLAREKRDTP